MYHAWNITQSLHGTGLAGKVLAGECTYFLLLEIVLCTLAMQWYYLVVREEEERN